MGKIILSFNQIDYNRFKSTANQYKKVILVHTNHNIFDYIKPINFTLEKLKSDSDNVIGADMPKEIYDFIMLNIPDFSFLNNDRVIKNQY